MQLVGGYGHTFEVEVVEQQGTGDDRGGEALAGDGRGDGVGVGADEPVDRRLLDARDDGRADDGRALLLRGGDVLRPRVGPGEDCEKCEGGKERERDWNSRYQKMLQGIGLKSGDRGATGRECDAVSSPPQPITAGMRWRSGEVKEISQPLH